MTKHGRAQSSSTDTGGDSSHTARCNSALAWFGSKQTGSESTQNSGLFVWLIRISTLLSVCTSWISTLLSVCTGRISTLCRISSRRLCWIALRLLGWIRSVVSRLCRIRIRGRRAGSRIRSLWHVSSSRIRRRITRSAGRLWNSTTNRIRWHGRSSTGRVGKLRSNRHGRRSRSRRLILHFENDCIHLHVSVHGQMGHLTGRQTMRKLGKMHSIDGNLVHSRLDQNDHFERLSRYKGKSTMAFLCRPCQS